MRGSIQKSSVLFISTFPPRKCGIVSFTQDLRNAIEREISDEVDVIVCALDKQKNKDLYESPVSMVMDAYDFEHRMEIAEKINKDDSVKLVCIEHEFGLFGGEYGEYLLGFLSMLDKPFIIRFHTVLPTPTPKMLKVVQAIGLLAEMVIVMTKNSSRILTEEYEMADDKIMIIPHGTHESSRAGASQLKLKYNLQGKQVLTTFGLLSPNKGIEKGILAMKDISKRFPDAVYVVLGQTHPNLIQQEGEVYREYLQSLIDENGLADNVRLINEYVPTHKLMEYLALTDIYLFTSKDPNQAVSGTFLYAMSAGCPIISNSFVLAKEMLDENTGIILESNREEEMAEAAIRILQDPQLKHKMSHTAYVRTRNSTWERVGQKHAELFSQILGVNVAATRLSNQYTV